MRSIVRRSSAILGCLTLPLLAAACSRAGDTAGPAAESGVRAVATADGVRLTNPTDDTIYYTAFERDWGERGLFLWGACIDPARCPSAAPRATVLIPLAEVNGWNERAREALVYYWRLVPAQDGGWEAADMRSIIAAP